jgi:hypothetical protein
MSIARTIEPFEAPVCCMRASHWSAERSRRCVSIGVADDAARARFG